MTDRGLKIIMKIEMMANFLALTNIISGLQGENAMKV